MPPVSDAPDHLANRVKLRLLMAGVEPGELRDLDEDAALRLLRSRLLWGDDEPITIHELAARTGLEVDVCRRARMLMGLPDPGDAPVCRSEEVESFRGFAAGIELYGEETILAFTRVLGSAMATVAEGSLSVFGKQLADRDPDELTGDAYVLAAFDALESFRIVPDVLGIVAKLQFDLATDRLGVGPGQTQQSAAVGFVDLTDSTRTTERLGTVGMSTALARFEEWAAELAVAEHGRVVKYIGDEVMYIAPELDGAVRVARGLLERVERDEVLGRARAGVAAGPMLGRDGDWYGTTVNIAARLIEKARSGTVLFTGPGADAVDGAVAAKLRRRLRDVPERVEVWRIG